MTLILLELVILILLKHQYQPLTFDITARGRNFAGSLNNINTEQVTIFSPGTFGAEVLSGSMAYYGRSQGYDGGSLTGTSGNTIFTEQLTGEDFRIIINDKLLTGSYASGDKPTTSTDVLYVQPPLELQVKPGYLVTPAGTYGYWLPANPSANTYQYYARAFQRNLSNGASDVTASFGAALNTWDSSANGVSGSIFILRIRSSGIYKPKNF